MGVTGAYLPERQQLHDTSLPGALSSVGSFEWQDARAAAQNRIKMLVFVRIFGNAQTGQEMWNASCDQFRTRCPPCGLRFGVRLIGLGRPITGPGWEA